MFVVVEYSDYRKEQYFQVHGVSADKSQAISKAHELCRDSHNYNNTGDSSSRGLCLVVDCLKAGIETEYMRVKGSEAIVVTYKREGCYQLREHQTVVEEYHSR